MAPNYVAEGSIPFLPAKFKVAGVAQLVEQWFCNPKVMGSSPFTSTTFRTLAYRFEHKTFNLGRQVRLLYVLPDLPDSKK